MASRSWNPVVLVVLLIASTLLLAMHSYSLRQQLSDLRIQAVRYRSLLERVTREKTEMRMTLGHMQRAMEKHSQRTKVQVDLEEKIRAKETYINQLKLKLADARKSLENGTGTTKSHGSLASGNKTLSSNVTSAKASNASTGRASQGLTQYEKKAKSAHGSQFSGKKVQPYVDVLKPQDDKRSVGGFSKTGHGLV